MSNTKKLNAVLYLGRFQCDYLPEGGTQSFRFPFTQEVIRDLDVFNVPLLLVQIKAFVEYFKIQPSELTILLADDILFSKTFTLPDPKSREDAIQSFIDSVPFEETAVLQIPFQNSVTVSIANKSYFEAFKKGFEAIGFSVPLTIPAFLLNKEINLAKSSDASSLAVALKHAPAHRQYSLLTQHSLTQASSAMVEKDGKLKTNKRTILLLGIFVILIGVLVIVYMLSNSQESAPVPTATQSQVSQEVTSTPQIEKVSFDSAEIVYQPIAVDQVDQITALLKEIGVVNVTSRSATLVATTSASTLYFSSTVTEGDRAILLTELQKIIPTVTIIEGGISSVGAVLNLN